MKIKPGVVISNRYEIISQIGSGGMSIVYKARDRKLGRIVTFKVMRGEYVKDQEFIKRFDIEARAAASLSHNNIVSVYDVGHDGLIYYIVMEFIDGITLKEIIKKRAPFSNEETLGVAVQVASALAHAHEHNIVHRDVKPQNILIMPNGVVKITDFGIAKASSAKTITIANNTMGSVHYFSPEQAKGGYVTFKSDIYSLGIVIFEMITGKLPFDGETPVAIALKQINNLVPDIKEFNLNASQKLQDIIQKATEKFASRRFDNMHEMEHELKHVLSKKDNNNEQEVLLDESMTIKISAEDIAKIKQENNLNDGYEYDLLAESEKLDADKKKEKKVIMWALITSGVIIFLFCFFGYQVLFNAKQIQAPELIGKSLDEANLLAKSLGIKIKSVGEEYNSQVLKDLISSQNYNPGESLYKGDVINIKISLGTKQVEMPFVINQDLSSAYEIFKNYLFDIDEIYEYSSTVPNNIIMKQSPAAGELINENANIVLYISRGQEIKNINVPNIIGLTESEAKIKLNACDLVVGTITKSESTKYPAGIVITQTVSAGKEVQTGTVVSFVISSGPPQIIITPSPEVTQPIEPNEEKILIVDPIINLPSDTQTVRIKILRVSQGGAEIFFEETVNIDQLPLRFNIPKEKSGEYQIYLVDQDGNSSYQGSSIITF